MHFKRRVEKGKQTAQLNPAWGYFELHISICESSRWISSSDSRLIAFVNLTLAGRKRFGKVPYRRRTLNSKQLSAAQLDVADVDVVDVVITCKARRRRRKV